MKNPPVDLLLIKKWLKPGDHQIIANRAECTSNYVYKTLKKYNTSVEDLSVKQTKVISISQDVAIKNMNESKDLKKKQNILKSA